MALSSYYCTKLQLHVTCYDMHLCILNAAGCYLMAGTTLFLDTWTLSFCFSVTKTNLAVHEDKNRVPYVKVGEWRLKRLSRHQGAKDSNQFLGLAFRPCFFSGLKNRESKLSFVVCTNDQFIKQHVENEIKKILLKVGILDKIPLKARCNMAILLAPQNFLVYNTSVIWNKIFPRNCTCTVCK